MSLKTFLKLLSVCVAAPGQGLFHPSWLLCVYQRMFHSENKSLMREGVCHLLRLQVLQQPDFAVAFAQVLAQTCSQHVQRLLITTKLSLCLCFLFCHFAPQFIVGPFMEVLSETSLFQR